MSLRVVTLKTAPQLRRIVVAADPSYKKHNAFFTVADQVALSGTSWDGGTRDTYRFVDIDTGKTIRKLPHYDPPEFGGTAPTPQAQLTDGVAVVRTGTFMGKTATAHVFVNSATSIMLGLQLREIAP